MEHAHVHYIKFTHHTKCTQTSRHIQCPRCQTLPLIHRPIFTVQAIPPIHRHRLLIFVGGKKIPPPPSPLPHMRRVGLQPPTTAHPGPRRYTRHVDQPPPQARAGQLVHRVDRRRRVKGEGEGRRDLRCPHTHRRTGLAGTPVGRHVIRSGLTVPPLNCSPNTHPRNRVGRSFPPTKTSAGSKFRVQNRCFRIQDSIFCDDSVFLTICIALHLQHYSIFVRAKKTLNTIEQPIWFVRHLFAAKGFEGT